MRTWGFEVILMQMKILGVRHSNYFKLFRMVSNCCEPFLFGSNGSSLKDLFQFEMQNGHFAGIKNYDSGE